MYKTLKGQGPFEENILNLWQKQFKYVSFIFGTLCGFNSEDAVYSTVVKTQIWDLKSPTCHLTARSLL